MPSTTPSLGRDPSTRAPRFLAGLVPPLDAFYRRHQCPLPPLECVEGEIMPEPYRALLVHEHDMTSTLESFHGEETRLKVISRQREGGDYYREVVLVLARSGKPVEFGAIHIVLDRFPEEAQRQILEERWPLGRILKERVIPFTSRPQAYLRIASDRLINEMLGLTGARTLYGRRNALFGADGLPLARIVEILPPAEEAGVEAARPASGTS